MTDLEVFLTAKGFISVPLILNGVGHFEIQAMMEGRPVCLIVDTGASGTVLDLGYIRNLGVELELQDMQAGGVGDTLLDIYLFSCVGFEIGACVIDPPVLYAMDLSKVRENLALKGVNADVQGILGADILSTCDAVLDYAQKRLFLKTPASNAPDSPAGEKK